MEIFDVPHNRKEIHLHSCVVVDKLSRHLNVTALKFGVLFTSAAR